MTSFSCVEDRLFDSCGPSCGVSCQFFRDGCRQSTCRLRLDLLLKVTPQTLQVFATAIVVEYIGNNLDFKITSASTVAVCPIQSVETIYKLCETSLTWCRNDEIGRRVFKWIFGVKLVGSVVFEDIWVPVFKVPEPVKPVFRNFESLDTEFVSIPVFWGIWTKVFKLPNRFSPVPRLLVWVHKSMFDYATTSQDPNEELHT